MPESPPEVSDPLGTSQPQRRVVLRRLERVDEGVVVGDGDDLVVSLSSPLAMLGLWRVPADGKAVRLRSPLDGEVVALAGIGDRVRAEFEKQVLADVPQQIEERVQRMIDWLVEAMPQQQVDRLVVVVDTPHFSIVGRVAAVCWVQVVPSRAKTYAAPELALELSLLAV